MNTEYTSFEPPEEKPHVPSSKSRLFHWWPPGFLGEDELEPLFSASSEEDAETEKEGGSTEEDQSDALAQRLAQAFRIIDKQVKQINELTEEIDQLEEAQRKTKDAVEKVKRSYQRGIQCVVGGLGLAIVLVFHREICQVGWNLFHWGTAALNLSPEDVVGFLTAAVSVWLFWKGAKWLWRSAVEDFFGEGGDEDDLGDR